jgi:hypothetical protein
VALDPERQARDDNMKAWHQQAVAAGQKRTLSRTMNGDLYSYARDELGFARAGSGAIVTSWWGMWVLAVVFTGIAVFSVVLVFAPTGQGQDPLWGALFLTLLSLGGVAYSASLAVRERSAKRVRRERGIPEPSPRQLN